ncbi:RxLR effector protein [Phytophthora megakarya]|uniref:RxLR effector protein n=1 Tax=Phytophthora megakarya TaxID=4795 RepID=A0A225V0W7_9STRA|nr:RxLR effector protein [Phytophthora megakarya]
MIGISSITKLNDLVKSGSESLKKLAESAKLKFASNSQLKTDTLFMHYKVGQIDVESNLLRSQQFQKWMKSVKKAYKKNPDAGNVAMTSKLISHYGDEPIANMLAAAREVRNNVFTLMKLDKAGDQMFESPVWNTYFSYLEKLDNENPKQLLFMVLQRHYDDEKLAKTLATAIQKDGSGIAEDMEKLQRASWMHTERTAHDVFKLLKLNQPGEELLKSQGLSTWVTYVKTLNKDPYDMLLLELRRDNDQKKIATLLQAAKHDYHGKTHAYEIANAQQIRWQKDGYNADDVFMMLRLNKDGDKLFENPVFATWMSYLTKLDKSNPDEAMYSVLKSHYGEIGLAKMMKIAEADPTTKNIAIKLQEEIWRSQQKTGDDIFNLFKLEQKEGEMFGSPEFSTWASYVKKLNTLDKTPDDVVVLSNLKKRYDDVELALMLGRSKKLAMEKNGSGLKVIRDLQTDQFRQWFVDGWDTNFVSGVMLAENRYDPKKDIQVITDYATFYKAATGHY